MLCEKNKYTEVLFLSSLFLNTDVPEPRDLQRIKWRRHVIKRKSNPIGKRTINRYYFIHV